MPSSCAPRDGGDPDADPATDREVPSSYASGDGAGGSARGGLSHRLRGRPRGGNLAVGCRARGERDDQRGLYLAERCDDWQGTEGHPGH